MHFLLSSLAAATLTVAMGFFASHHASAQVMQAHGGYGQGSGGGYRHAPRPPAYGYGHGYRPWRQYWAPPAYYAPQP